MSRIEVVVSDFGGVLTTPLMQAFAAVQENSGIPWEQFGAGMARAAELAGTQPLFELERGAISEAEFVRQLDVGMSEVLGREVTLHGFGEQLFAALHPNEQLIDYMRVLRGRGYRMAILTNNVREWEARWRAMLPIDEIFELVIDSAFVSMRKPEPEIYQLLLEETRGRGVLDGLHRRSRGQLRRGARARHARRPVPQQRSGDRRSRGAARRRAAALVLTHASRHFRGPASSPTPPASRGRGAQFSEPRRSQQ